MKPRLLLILVFLAALGCLAEAKTKDIRARNPVRRQAGKPSGRAVPLDDEEAVDPSANGEAPPAEPLSPETAEETPQPDPEVTDAPPTEGPPAPAAPETPDQPTELDPFDKNKQWTEMVHRVDRIIKQAKKLATEAAGAFSKISGKDNLMDFLKKFSETYTAFSNFLSPVDEELMEDKPYSKVDPAIGLTDLLKLNEWAKTGGGPEALDKERVKWVEVNSYGVSMHYEFDRLVKQIKDWGLEEVNDTVAYGYPSWVKDVSHKADGESYKLWELDSITKELDTRVVETDPMLHIMRSLEKMLRNKTTEYDLTGELNYYCYANNPWGTISTTFDILTDAAVYLSMADVKVGLTQVTLAIMREWQKQMGVEDLTKGIEGGYNFPDAPPAPADLNQAVEQIFVEVQTRVDRKIKFPTLGEEIDYMPGPVVYHCDIKSIGNGTHVPLDPITSIPILSNNTILPPGCKPPPGTPNVVHKPQWGIIPPEGPYWPFVMPPGGGYFAPPDGPDPDKPGFKDQNLIDVPEIVGFDRYKGMIEVEQVLNPDGSCKSTCPDYRRPTETCVDKEGQPRNGTDCQDHRNSFCKDGDECWKDVPTCQGKARRCIRTSYEVQFCKGDKDKLYHWLKINGTMIPEGADEKCDSGVVNLKERWEMQFGVIVRTPQYCEVCQCVCENDVGTSHFSIAPIVAEDGHVLVAFKFSKTEDKVIRLEAQQAKVDQYGRVIDSSSAKWVDSGPVDKTNPKEVVQLGEGEEKFTKMGLDNVYVKKNQMVTGVKFVNEAGILRISVRGTVMKNGELQKSGEEWFTRNHPEPVEPTKVFTVDDRRASDGQIGPGQPLLLPENKLSVLFDASSLVKDGGQATIPQFDAQPTLTSVQRRALHAVGILYKTKTDYGGYLTTSITNYHHAYMDDE